MHVNTTPSKPLDEDFQRRKFVWTMISIIVIALLVLITTIPATILILKKTNAEKRATIEETTMVAKEITTTTTSEGPLLPVVHNIVDSKTKWYRNASTVAGGDLVGNKSDRLFFPTDIHVDDDDDRQSIYIADTMNSRILEWKIGANHGHVLGDGDKQGNRTDQVKFPAAVIVDRKKDALIICDPENRRVLQWSRRNITDKQILIANIECCGLAMGNNEDLYVSDCANDTVRRWGQGDTHGTIVAGGHGKGKDLNQLDAPRYIFVDRDYTVYVSDQNNHRVMKWKKGAIEGIVVAGGHDRGNSPAHLSHPMGVMVDQSSNIYVADYDNYRVMRWFLAATRGHSIAGGYGDGQQPHQLTCPRSLSFDRQGNLYVLDMWNHRVQKFRIHVD